MMKKILLILISISIIAGTVFLINYIKEYKSYTIIKENFTKELSRENALITILDIIYENDIFSHSSTFEEYYMYKGKIIVSEENIVDIKRISPIYGRFRILSKEELDSLDGGLLCLRTKSLNVNGNAAQATVENATVDERNGVGGIVIIHIQKRGDNLYYKIVERGIY